MKFVPFLALIILAAPIGAQNETAPAEQTPAPIKLLPNQQAFLNLPEESRKEFLKHLNEANRVFQQKRVFECLEELHKASQIFAESPELLNLRGSCYVEMRAFDKALADYSKAAALAKDNPNVQFNIGEVYFVTKQWQQAHDMFENVLRNLPPDNIGLGRLVEFKLLLCKKKLGRNEEVAVLAEKYDFLDDSPFHYFAQAALAYENKEMIKAEQWLARAGRVFRDPNILAPWQDTLVEFGYIKSFYGEDEVVE